MDGKFGFWGSVLAAIALMAWIMPVDAQTMRDRNFNQQQDEGATDTVPDRWPTERRDGPAITWFNGQDGGRIAAGPDDQSDIQWERHWDQDRIQNLNRQWTQRHEDWLNGRDEQATTRDRRWDRPGDIRWERRSFEDRALQRRFDRDPYWYNRPRLGFEADRYRIGREGYGWFDRPDRRAYGLDGLGRFDRRFDNERYGTGLRYYQRPGRYVDPYDRRFDREGDYGRRHFSRFYDRDQFDGSRRFDRFDPRWTIDRSRPYRSGYYTPDYDLRQDQRYIRPGSILDREGQLWSAGTTR